MSRPVSRRTKIVATLGPASDSDITIAQLLRAGVDVFRLNFSHGEPGHHAASARRIRHQAALAGRHVGILADLQGPKIRIGGFRNDSVELTPGQHFRLDARIDDAAGDQHGVGFSFETLTQYLRPQDTLLLDDGRIQLTVEHVEENAADCTVLLGGQLGSNKGINRLGGGIAAPALTEKDIADIESLGAVNPDFVAVSFVSHIRDIEHTRALLSRHGLDASIIAKIERAEVVADDAILDDILQASAGIMVARGDLGVEVGDAELIGIQKDLISRARRANRLVITATQMMESMIHEPIPTRAEVSDVANAVIDGTDAVMLSGETAVGRYPVKAVQAMAGACVSAEKQRATSISHHRMDQVFQRTDEAIAMATMYIANHMNVKAIVALTESGSTALWMSRIRSGIPIYAFSRNEGTRRRVVLYRGVYPVPFDVTLTGDDGFGLVCEALKSRGIVAEGDRILLTEGREAGVAGGTNTLRVLMVG